MKLKSLSLIAGAIALTLTTTSLAAKAQTLSHSSLLIAQEQGQRQGKKGPWAELGLNDAQKAQIEQIKRDTRTQIENVFTQEQKDKLKAAYEARRAERQANQGQQPGQRVGRRPGKGFADLNLTEDQKSRIRAIRESSKQKIQAVLTEEQRAKLQQLRENAKQRRQQRQQGGGL